MKEAYNKSFCVRYTPVETNGTGRIAILEDLFALDARRLMPLTRKEPSHMDALYLDIDCIIDIKNSFGDLWAISHEICLTEAEDIKPP